MSYAFAAVIADDIERLQRKLQHVKEVIACGPEGHMSVVEIGGVVACNYDEQWCKYIALKKSGIKRLTQDIEEVHVDKEDKECVETMVRYHTVKPLYNQKMNGTALSDRVVAGLDKEGHRWFGVSRGNDALKSAHSPSITWLGWRN